MLRRWLILVFTGLLFAIVKSEFPLSELKIAKELQESWEMNVGYDINRWFTMMNCSAAVMEGGGYIETMDSQQYWQICHRHHLQTFCGSNGNSTSLIPLSSVCSDQVKVFGNYRACMTSELIQKEKKCVAISIGSNNKWEFEEALYNHSICEIHTFDPRIRDNFYHKIIKVPEAISTRAFFHNRAVGLKNNNGMTSFKTAVELSNVTSTNNLSLLKIDCEGCELYFFSYLQKSGQFHLLPHQILMEVHLKEFRFRQIETVHVYIDLISSLFKAGYVVFDNRIGDGGCELGFVKVF